MVADPARDGNFEINAQYPSARPCDASDSAANAGSIVVTTLNILKLKVQRDQVVGDHHKNQVREV